MPIVSGSISGAASHKLLIGDKAPGASGLVETDIKDYVDSWEIVFEDGFTERTPHGAQATDHEKLLENHVINVSFKPYVLNNNTATTLALLLRSGSNFYRAFDHQVQVDATNKKGIRITGNCYIRRSRVPFTSDRRVVADVSYIMAGQSWALTDTTT